MDINEHKICIKVVECTDTDIEYGALIIPEDKIIEIQEEIYNIKDEFYKLGVEDWTVEDVIDKLQYKYPEIEQVVYATNDYLEV